MWIVITVLHTRCYIAFSQRIQVYKLNLFLHWSQQKSYCRLCLAFFQLMTGKQLLKERPLLYGDMMGLRKATGKYSYCAAIALFQKSRTKQLRLLGRWQRDYPNAVLFLFLWGQPSTETHTSTFPPRRLFNPRAQGFPSHPHCWLVCS